MFLLTQNNLMEFGLTGTYGMLQCREYSLLDCFIKLEWKGGTATFACFTNSSVSLFEIKTKQLDRMQIITRHAVQIFEQIGTEEKDYISYSKKRLHIVFTRQVQLW